MFPHPVVAFLTYLEVHSSILRTNPKKILMFINFLLFPLFPHVGRWPISPLWADYYSPMVAEVLFAPRRVAWDCRDSPTVAPNPGNIHYVT